MAINRTSPKKGKVVDIPTAPTIGTATAGAELATVAFTAATKGGPATTYTALSNPGSITGSGSSSPITLTGLTAGTSYTFTVRGNNATGSGEYSVASNSVVPEVQTSYESIATVNVTSTTSSITFSSIPSTYTHLQIRATVIPAGGDNMIIRLNGDAGANYSTHQIQGTGASVVTGADSTTEMYLMGLFQTGSSPFVGIWDFLDYKNTNKYKTVKGLVGTNDNSSSTSYRVGLSSGNWRNTAAINTITMRSAYSSGFSQYSQFALYGIKG